MATSTARRSQKNLLGTYGALVGGLGATTGSWALAGGPFMAPAIAGSAFGAGVGTAIGKEQDEKIAAIKKNRSLSQRQKTTRTQKEIEKGLQKTGVAYYSSLGAGLGYQLMKHGGSYPMTEANIGRIRKGKKPKRNIPFGAQLADRSTVRVAVRYPDPSKHLFPDADKYSRLSALELRPTKGKMFNVAARGAKNFKSEEGSMSLRGGASLRSIDAHSTSIEYNPVKIAAALGATAAVTGGGIYAYKHKEQIKDRVHKFSERHPIRRP